MHLDFSQENFYLCIHIGKDWKLTFCNFRYVNIYKLVSEGKMDIVLRFNLSAD